MSENFPVRSDGPPVVERAKAILLNPTAEWQKIALETTPPKQVLLKYAVPLAAIGPIAGLIGMQLFGFSVLGITYRPTLVSSIGGAIANYVLSLVGLFILAWVANFLSPKFGGREDWPAAFRLVAYSMTANWLAAIFALIPALSILGILGLYSIFLYYRGAQPVMNVPKDKTLSYTVVTVLVAFVVYLVIGLIVALFSGLGMNGAELEQSAAMYGTL